MNAEEIAAGRERWQRRYDAATIRDARPGVSGVSPGWHRTTVSGLAVDPVYGPRPGDAVEGFERIGWPGEFPFTRGLYPTGYRGRTWTIRQFAGFGNAGQTNERYRMILEAGGGGLSVAFDMPTLMGRDSDDPRSLGEVGHCGVAVDSAADLDVLFGGLPLEQVTTSMTISGPAVPVFCMYVVAPERHLRLIGDLMEYCAAEIPRYKPMSVSGYHIREAGSTAAQELAFTLADGFAYIELAQRRGLDPAVVAQQLSFFFDAHIDFFEEIGKFRAARRIWARWMRDRYGISEPKAQQLKFHTQTAGVSLTAQQPDNNVVRTALEALSAVLGGTQSLHTNALDEVFALPTERAAAIALRTQQVIAEETGVAATIDPLGGSWFVEQMTDLQERRAEELFATIDRFGDGSMLEGVLAGIEQGWFQQQMADAAFAYQQQVEKGAKVIVGVNKYVTDNDQELEILRISEQVEREQRAELARRRSARRQDRVDAALDRLQRAASTDENLIPLLVEAARAEATEGEMVTALRQVWGDYTEPPRF